MPNHIFVVVIICFNVFPNSISLCPRGNRKFIQQEREREREREESKVELVLESNQSEKSSIIDQKEKKICDFHIKKVIN